MFSIRFPAALAAGFFACSTLPALAETIDVTGTGHGTSTTQVMPVSESLIVVSATSMYERFETANPMNPFASASGPCFGAMKIDKGAVSGGGLCRYTDSDGDVAVVNWMAKAMTAEGRTQGDWMIEGGTGKWATITGGGTFDAGEMDGAYTNKITGSVTTN
ncbi:hypothetical protein [Thetidibacter halocola]|uniref:Uncharacterized protein n=1 Tax=Thetidibacter halocola TaxID=2827239 RepID=A0A8J7WEQ0_9RHOB|nr:hypothetical protein [Thetidibacter halocola]MBS0125427.1 hypothetical protein [Thetidibacter halocola]